MPIAPRLFMLSTAILYALINLATWSLRMRRTDAPPPRRAQDAPAHQQPCKACWPGGLWTRNHRECCIEKIGKSITAFLLK